MSSPDTSDPDTSSLATSKLSPEQHSINFVPLNERYGKPTSLFTLWFGANLQVTGIAAGAISVAIGVPLPWAVIGTILGHLVGAVFMALHSAQGPILGIPQMIQSRAQFGYLGAIIPLILVILMYLGYFATTAAQGGSALSSLTTLPVEPSIIVVVIVTILLTVYGYKWLHGAQKVLSVASGITFLILSICLLGSADLSAFWSFTGFQWAPFLVTVAIAATWQLTYAPYVADYSRYLPPHTSVRTSFWWTYAGSVLASIWMFCFGAVATAIAPEAFDGGSVDFIVDQAPIGRPLWLLVIIGGVIGVNALNLYGAFMSFSTILNSVSKIGIGRMLRIGIIVLVAIIATTISIAGRGNFLDNFSAFILLLAYFLIPWTSINLADFYLVRKEKYRIGEMFKPRGEYGGFDWRALTAYFVGIIVELPFIASDFYTGPFATALGGADLSWIIAIFVAGGIYVILMRRFPTRAKYPAGTEEFDAPPTTAV